MFSFVVWAVLATQQQAREAMEPKYSIPRPVVEPAVERPVNISRDPRAEPTTPVSKPKW